MHQVHLQGHSIFRHVIKQSIWVFCFSWGFYSCSQPNAGVPSSVETQNSVAGILQSPTGTPLAKIQVELRKASQAGVALQSTLTDSVGHYQFTVSDSDYYSLTALQNQVAFWRSLSRPIEQTEPTKVATTSPITFQVALTANSWGQNQLLEYFILGTGIHGQWNTQSPLELQLPGEGSYVLSTKFQSVNREAIINAKTNATQSIILTETPSLPFIDFGQNCKQNLLEPLFGENWNFAVYGSGTILPSGLSSNFSAACSSDIEHGTVAQISFTPTSSESWFSFGSLLSTSQGSVDLSNMDSLEIWVKGSGILYLGIVTSDMVNIADYQFAMAPSIELSPTWARHNIKFDDIEYPLSSQAYQKGLRWKNSSKVSRILQFNLGVTTQIMFDDIRFYGISASDL